MRRSSQLGSPSPTLQRMMIAECTQRDYRRKLWRGGEECLNFCYSEQKICHFIGISATFDKRHLEIRTKRLLARMFS
jgi:hypothetical protein